LKRGDIKEKLVYSRISAINIIIDIPRSKGIFQLRNLTMTANELLPINEDNRFAMIMNMRNIAISTDLT
jgi:hypothetical protein